MIYFSKKYSLKISCLEVWKNRRVVPCMLKMLLRKYSFSNLRENYIKKKNTLLLFLPKIDF